MRNFCEGFTLSFVLATLKELDPERYEEALEFCFRDPFRTLPIAHWIREHLEKSPYAQKGWLLGEISQSRSIVGLALLSDTGILYPAIHSDESVEQLRNIGKVNPNMIRVLLGPEDLVEHLWKRLQSIGMCARIDQRQLLYVTNRKLFRPVEPLLDLKIAQLRNLDILVEASAAMAKEESGDDARQRNPVLFRDRIATRLLRQRDFIFQKDNELIFKASVSSIIPEVGQIEGVYTLDKFRRQGYGGRGTSFVINWILQRSASSALLVNCDNFAARKMYQRLGFQTMHLSRTIFLTPSQM